MTNAISPRRTLLMQLSPASARDLFTDWHHGHDFYYPAVSRNAGDVELDDLIVFWMSGPSDRAGVVGFGLASGQVMQLEHPVSYRNPDGPTTRRDSVEVALGWVGESAIITRKELLNHTAFGEFELFKMANRPNAFAVSDDQAAVVLGRLEEVLAK